MFISLVYVHECSFAITNCNSMFNYFVARIPLVFRVWRERGNKEKRHILEKYLNITKEGFISPGPNDYYFFLYFSF